MLNPGVTVQIEGNTYVADANGELTLPRSLWIANRFAPPPVPSAVLSLGTILPLPGERVVQVLPRHALVDTVSTGLGWNDYVRVGDYHSPCLATDDENTCVHAAEERGVHLSEETSCAGIAANDVLDVFEWKCEAHPVQGILIVGQLKSSAGLSDLIDSHALGWRPNQLRLQRGSEILNSPLENWWVNPIIPLENLTATGTSGNLTRIIPSDLSGSIVVVRASTSDRVQINANRVALVTAPGAQLAMGSTPTLNCGSNGESGTSNHCAISAGTQSQLWIEATILGSIQHYGINWVNVTRSRIDRTRMDKALLNSLVLKSSHKNLITRSAFSRGGSHNILLDASNQNRIESVLSSGQTGAADLIAGITLSASSNNRLSKITSVNNYRGLIVIGNASKGNTVTASNISHNQRTGLVFSATTANSTGGHIGHNVVLSNNGGAGPTAHGFVADKVVFSMLSQAAIDASMDLSTQKAMTAIDARKIRVRGNLLVSDPVCHFIGANSDIDFGSNCLPVAAGLYDHREEREIKDSYSMLGQVDSLNASEDSSGTAPFSLIDTIRFENLFRFWGKLQSISYALNQNGGCTTGNCQLYDWRPLAATSIVHATSNGIHDEVAHRFVPHAPCPAGVTGDQVLQNDLLTPPDLRSYQTFLKNAVEFLDRGNGNHDGLCESGETCLYTPHFGSYQGEGELQECAFQDGVITGVRMLGYE